MKFLRIVGPVLLSLWVGAAYAACPVTSITVKDGTGTSQVLCYGGASGAYINSTAVTDSSGNVIGTTTVGVAGLNVSDNKLQVTTAADGLTNPTIPDVLGFLFGYNGSSWDRLRDDANFFLNVDLGATTDTRPAVQNISAVDSASTTTAGQNGINQITGTPSAQSAAAQAIQGQATSIVQITGTGNGTIAFEAANDGSGTTWSPVLAHQRGASGYMYSITGSALNGTYEIPVSGMSNVRLRATAWTSGASAPKWSFAQAAGNVQVTGGNLSAGFSQQVADTPTVTASAYASGNCIGGFRSITVTNNNGQSGLITNFRIVSAGGSTPTVTVYLFGANPSSSTCTDKSTFTLATADIDKMIATPTAATLAVPTGATAAVGSVDYTPPRPFVAGGSTSSGVQTIYYALVSGSVFTPGSTSDIHTRIGAVLN